jgi:hypothetical protein
LLLWGKGLTEGSRKQKEKEMEEKELSEVHDTEYRFLT